MPSIPRQKDNNYEGELELKITLSYQEASVTRIFEYAETDKEICNFLEFKFLILFFAFEDVPMFSLFNVKFVRSVLILTQI